MSRKTQLLVVSLAVLAVTSVTSHVVARRLRIRVQAVTPLSFGEKNSPKSGVVAGSSVAFYGINWSEVTRATGTKLQGWAVPDRKSVV